MNQYKKNGMWIRQTEPVGRKETGWILSMIVAMFSSGIWLLTVGKLTGFDEIYVQWVMLISASCVCIAYGIIAGYKKQKWFLPGFLFLLLVLVVFGGTWILNGFCMFVNQLGDTWTAGCGSVLPELAISSKAEDICLLLFSVFMGSVTALFCCVVTSFEKRILGLILPVFLLAGMLLFRQESTFVYLIPVLLFAVCLMACNGRQEVKRPMTAMLYRWVPILCSSMLLLFLAVMPKVENWAIGIGEKTQERLHISRYETAYTTLPEGDFTDYTEKEGEDKTALVVSMEQPEELYLRGFTGAVFGNKANFVTFVNTESNIPKKHAVAIAFGQIFNLEIANHATKLIISNILFQQVVKKE